jgi:hypothetical protein
MRRYRTITPLVAIQAPGVMASLPRDVTVEVSGTSAVPGMVEVLWQSKSYAVFELDLNTRALPEANPELIAS